MIIEAIKNIRTDPSLMGDDELCRRDSSSSDTGMSLKRKVRM